METSPQFNQTTNETPHVLHPERELPTFDIVAVNKMIQPSVAPSQTLEQIVTPAREPKLHVRENVLRPDTEKRRGISNRAKALAAAAIVGLSGAMMTDNAEAGGVPGLEQAGKTIAAGFINGMLARTPIAVGVDSQGNVGVVAKNPSQMAAVRPSMREPGVEQIAASMGLSIIEQGSNFSIIRNANPGESPIIINKFSEPGHYTETIKLMRSPNGGLLLVNVYIMGGVSHTDMAYINIDQTGKMVANVIKG